ncbi:hypothetical protein [Cloacibacterium sp.]|uniref:hypothetical protein n=1 Tax=Cloacibacterium sp. TaxID=1913682 RepID=UPI0039E3F8C8
MKNFKFEQIKVLLILSFLILVLHFFIMFIGNFPGGQYGMVPFILIIGLPIYIIILIVILFLLNLFKIILSPVKVALLYTIIYLFFFSIDGGLSDQGMIELFVYPSIISLIGFLAVNYLISEN